MKKKVAIVFAILIALIILGGGYFILNEYNKITKENEQLKEKINSNSERLMGRTWINRENSVSVQFTNNSFTLTYINRSGEKIIITGSYEIVGDYVLLTNSAGEKWDGTIIGSTLTLSGDRGINSELSGGMPERRF